MIPADDGFDNEQDEPRFGSSERKVHPLPSTYKVMKRLLTREEEIELCQRAQQGDEKAREQMMDANIRLVISVARRYNGRSLTFEDLVQEGVIGLLEAINKFDIARGYRFSTYATYWIRQGIVRAIEKTDRMIRLPTYGCNAERKVRQAETRLEETLGRTPTVEEISRETGLSATIVRALVHFTNEPLSLDAMVGNDLDTMMADLIADDEAVDPAVAIMRLAGIASLEEVLRVLDPRERSVIECRFGLRDGRLWTLKECADLFDLSREGVRQTQVRAIKKLKSAARKHAKVNPDLAYSVESLHNH